MGKTATEKKALRQAYRARGAALTEDYRRRADRAICAAVLDSDQWKRAESVFAFVSMWAEPDTRPLLEAAQREGKRLYLPRCCPDGIMQAVRVYSLDALIPGAYGIPEPPADAKTAQPGELALALVPCVTVTRDGTRLGHGAGYYDRFLPLHRCETLSLCYAAMLADALPTDEYDVRMDHVVTEDGVIKCVSA